MIKKSSISSQATTSGTRVTYIITMMYVTRVPDVVSFELYEWCIFRDNTPVHIIKGNTHYWISIWLFDCYYTYRLMRALVAKWNVYWRSISIKGNCKNLILLGVDVGDRWQQLCQYRESHADDHFLVSTGPRKTPGQKCTRRFLSLVHTFEMSRSVYTFKPKHKDVRTS